MNQQKQNKTSTILWLIITAIIISPIILILLYRIASQSEFDRRVEALSAQGFPVSVDELEKQYSLDEDIENAADIYILAFMMQQKPTPEEIDYIPITGKYKQPPPYPQEVLDALKSYLKRNQNTLDLLDQAAKTEVCLWPKTRNIIWRYNNKLTEISNAARLLIQQNLYLAHTGKTNELYDSMLTAIAISETFSNQPLLIDHLVSIYIKNLCVNNLENILTQADFTDDQLIMLQNIFARIQNTNGLHDALIFERCDVIEFWQLPPDQQTYAAFGSP